MNETSIISNALGLYYTTDLNTYLLNANGDFLLNYESIAVPSFMPGANDEDILYFFKKIHSNQLYSYSNEWGLFYLGYQFTAHETYTIIIGPYLTVTPNYFNLTKKYHLNSKENQDLRLICNQMQVLTSEQVRSYSNVLQTFEYTLQKKSKPIYVEPENMGEYNVKKENIVSKVDEDEDVEVIKLRYKVEEDFIHAVETGDKKRALELIDSNNILFSFSERFPNQPMLRVKNLAIVLNTQLRIAARNKNVPTILVHRISDKYAYKIQYTNQLAKLQQLYDEMIIEYCDLIIENSLVKYSKDIQKVIEYLISYYDQPIEIDELAELTNKHPSHLSRKFKQETNLTIKGYQQMLRMNRAKYLLKSETLPIEEIAWLVGYEDSSYFTRVFKKETGLTPTQYREKV